MLFTSYRLFAHESSKIIAEVGSNIGLIFLDDRNFERKVQQAIENAGFEEVQRVRATLEKNLKLWFPTTSEYFLNIIKIKKLFWSLIKNGTTSDTDTFEHNLKNILDGDNQVRMKALTLLIDNKLFEELKADLIFDDKKLFEHILEGVRVTEKKTSDFFFGVPLKKIESGHSNSCYDFLLPVLEASTNAPEALPENTDEQ